MIEELFGVFNIEFVSNDLEQIGKWIHDLRGNSLAPTCEIQDYYLTNFSRPFIVTVIYTCPYPETTINNFLSLKTINDGRKSTPELFVEKPKRERVECFI